MNLAGLFDDRYGFNGEFNSYKCTKCTHAFIGPELTIRLADLYENYYQRDRSDVRAIGDAATREASMSSMKRWFLGIDNCGQWWCKKGSRLLDIGSGDCSAVFVAKICQIDGHGFDVDSNSARIGAQLGVHVYSGESLMEAVGEERFDWVQLNQVVEHFVDPVSSLREITQVMTAEGLLFIATPNESSFSRKLFGRRWIHWHVPYHQHHFTEKSLRLALQNAGLQVEFRTFRTPTDWFLTQLRRLAVKDSKGTTSPIWTTETTQGFFGRRAQGILRSLSMFVLAVPSRLLDLLRVGDCLVVVARRVE